MCYLLLKDELHNAYTRAVLVKSVKGTFAIAEVMTSGIGSVVSPIPRLIICASGYFSKCADLLLAICLHFPSERSVI